MGKTMRYCTRCLTPSTRPRLVFNEEAVCNACVHAEDKKNSIDWDARWKELEELCDRFRINDGANWDVLVPCSGGKDGSYVAWRLKHDLGMHPLAVTLMPQAQTEIGCQNLENFKKSGFDHIAITPNLQVYKRLAIKGFKEQGRPKMPFVTGISTVTIKVALKFGIPLIVYGEEGETEYGGSTRQMHRRRIDRQYLVDFYYSGHDPIEYLDEFTCGELRWWMLPSQEELDKFELVPTHWSHFENWDPELHAKLAKEKCGMQTLDAHSVGTYSDYAQLDDVLQDLHAYMMFIKFGFGRTTSDAGIDIRAGRLTREEGVELVKKYDGRFPEQYLPVFLEYFEMTKEEFWTVVDSFANTEVLEKVDGRWLLKPAMIKGLERGGEFIL
jgi:N-acetyl sugar amidotransferase